MPTHSFMMVTSCDAHPFIHVFHVLMCCVLPERTAENSVLRFRQQRVLVDSSIDSASDTCMMSSFLAAVHRAGEKAKAAAAGPPPAAAKGMSGMHDCSFW